MGYEKPPTHCRMFTCPPPLGVTNARTLWRCRVHSRMVWLPWIACDDQPLAARADWIRPPRRRLYLVGSK